MQFLYSSLVLLLASVSLFGWGKLVQRATRVHNIPSPLTISLGLALVLFIGGVVNVTRISFAPTLWLIATVGVILSVFFIRKTLASSVTHARHIWANRNSAEYVEVLVTLFLILTVAAFSIATQLPPDRFNLNDDFQKYLAHPVRELATGTLFGSPLSALGSETLGGMAFLHSFVLSTFPISYINGVDAIFGLMLLMTLAAVAGWRQLGPLPGAFLASLLVVLIEPQYVNVSALYLGAALVAASVMLTIIPEYQVDDRPSSLALGLIFGGLVALKPTFAIVPAIEVPLLLLGFSIIDGSIRKNISWAARVALWTIGFISPWIFLHAPHYLSSSIVATEMPPAKTEIISPFSTEPLIYGASECAYTSLVGLAILVIILGFIGAYKSRSNAEKKRYVLLAVTASAYAIIYLIFFFLLPPTLGKDHSIRYAVPIFIGIFPVVIIITSGLVFSWSRSLAIATAGSALLLTSVAFLPSLQERYDLAKNYHTMLRFWFAKTPFYLEYSRMALSEERFKEIRKIQEIVPVNEPVLVWINQPYDLDFRRNQVFDVEPAGLATPWTQMPPARYVIWEYQGPGVDTDKSYLQAVKSSVGIHNQFIAVSTLKFGLNLGATLKKSKILFSNGNFVVAKLLID